MPSEEEFHETIKQHTLYHYITILLNDDIASHTQNGGEKTHENLFSYYTTSFASIHHYTLFLPFLMLLVWLHTSLEASQLDPYYLPHMPTEEELYQTMKQHTLYHYITILLYDDIASHTCNGRKNTHDK